MPGPAQDRLGNGVPDTEVTDGCEPACGSSRKALSAVATGQSLQTLEDASWKWYADSASLATEQKWLGI